MDLWGTRGDAEWKEVVTPLIPGDDNSHILTRVALTAGPQDTAAPTILTEVPSGWVIGTVHRQGMPAQLPGAAAFPPVAGSGSPGRALSPAVCSTLASRMPARVFPTFSAAVRPRRRCVPAGSACLPWGKECSQSGGASSRSSPGTAGPGRALVSILGNWTPVIRVTKEV